MAPLLPRHPETGELTSVAKTILTTVASGLIVSALYAGCSTYRRFQDLDAQMMYFHGPWPPVREGPPR